MRVSSLHSLLYVCHLLPSHHSSRAPPPMSRQAGDSLAIALVQAMTTHCRCCSISVTPSGWVHLCTCAAGYYRTAWSTTVGGWLCHAPRRAGTTLSVVRAAVTTNYANCTPCPAGQFEDEESNQDSGCEPCPTGFYAAGAYGS